MRQGRLRCYNTEESAMYEPVKGVKGWRGYVYGIYTRESFSVSWSYENKKEDFPEEKSSKVNLCARRDSNPHASRH